jgi:hypothetical protein
MNHLEQLVSEWLQYRGYFVRTSVPVGPRPQGGYAGELDVVAVHPATKKMLHIECSLDALSEEKRQARYALKFLVGHAFAKEVFEGFDIEGEPEKIVVLQFASGRQRNFGGARMVTVRDLIAEIRHGLLGTSPARKAVSVNMPLLRTLQMAFDAMPCDVPEHSTLPISSASAASTGPSLPRGA